MTDFETSTILRARPPRVLHSLFDDEALGHPPVRGGVRQGAALTMLELCAGAGGAALGLEQAGFFPVALIDNDEHACATLNHNRPHWNVIEADIRHLNARDWRGVDLVSGGLPCPPFSIAGKQLGQDDERNLFPAMLRIVKAVHPRAVLIENVRGILQPRFSEFRAKIDKKLDFMGYATDWKAFDAAAFGVPQRRIRTFLVARRRGETKPLASPVALAGRPATVGEAIVDLIGENGWPGASKWKKRASTPAPTIVGGSKKHGGPDLGPTRARRAWAGLGVDGRSLADKPPSRYFVGMPRLTVRMVARLQGFPDEWEFIGSKTDAYRQVGNALPVKLAEAIGSAVRNCLV